MERTAEARILDLNGGQIFHAVQVDGGEWHFSGINYTGVGWAFNATQIMKYISERVHEMKFYSVEVNTYKPSHGKVIHPDMMGNCDLDGKFLSLAEALREMFSYAENKERPSAESNAAGKPGTPG